MMEGFSCDIRYPQLERKKYAPKKCISPIKQNHLLHAFQTLPCEHKFKQILLFQWYVHSLVFAMNNLEVIFLFKHHTVLLHDFQAKQRDLHGLYQFSLETTLL